jgi:hypothetical protein
MLLEPVPDSARKEPERLAVVPTEVVDTGEPPFTVRG